MACIPVSVSSSRQITMRWAVGLRPCPAPVVSAIARQHYDEAADLLERQGIQAEVVKLNQLTPLVPELIEMSVRKTGALLVAEEQAARGSVGQRLAARLEVAGLPARMALVNCGDGFVPHGSSVLLKRDLALNGEGICEKALEVLGRGQTET